MTTRITGTPIAGWIVGTAVFGVIAALTIRELQQGPPISARSMAPEPSLGHVDLGRIGHPNKPGENPAERGDGDEK